MSDLGDLKEGMRVTYSQAFIDSTGYAADKPRTGTVVYVGPSIWSYISRVAVHVKWDDDDAGRSVHPINLTELKEQP